MDKQGYHHGGLKAQMIKEGLLLLNHEGYEGFSMRKVARACHVSQTAPYRHFKDKDELISAIALQALEAFQASLERAVITNPDDPKAALREMGIAYVRFFAENPEYLKLLFLSDITKALEDADFCKPESHLSQGHPFATLYETVRHYKKAYPDDTRTENELLLYCWGLVHGISVLIAGAGMPVEDDYIALTERILNSERFL